MLLTVKLMFDWLNEIGARHAFKVGHRARHQGR